jgi:hypothetical protein
MWPLALLLLVVQQVFGETTTIDCAVPTWAIISVIIASVETVIVASLCVCVICQCIQK